MIRNLAFGGILLCAATQASAQGTQEALSDSGDTAWILVSAALVLLMTLPGLGLFYGGLVRAKNFLSVMLQVAAVAGIASILWVLVGYTLAFGDSVGGWIGDGRAFLLDDLYAVVDGLTIPESTFALFQMTFAAITPALMIGAWVDRARFSWVILFCALWGLVVYAPVAHWIWGGGWLSSQHGTLDFAGGIVVHTTAGVSALIIALLLGKRRGFPTTPLLPHAPGLTMLGAMLLWVGWFGFNGGSALNATDDASTAIINTHVAASAAALVWILIERVALGKSTTVGFATGAIAGLATITPAAGFVSPGGAVLFGVAGSVICYGAIQLVKQRLKIDDSLDVFAVHGVGGMFGSLMLAYTADATFSGQLVGVVAVAIFSAVATAVLALAVSLFFPMRVDEEEEVEGLDITSHGERSWELD